MCLLFDIDYFEKIEDDEKLDLDTQQKPYLKNWHIAEVHVEV